MIRASHGTLLLTFLSAGAVLLLGLTLSRKTTETVDSQAQILRVTFAAGCLRQLEDLSALYENHLFDLYESMSTSSEIEIVSRARNLKGVTQITTLEPDKRKQILPISKPITEAKVDAPRLIGTEPDRTGLLLDPIQISPKWGDKSTNWIKRPGYPLHFAVSTPRLGVVAMQLDEEAIADAMEEWLADWLPEQIAILNEAGIQLILQVPAIDRTLAQTDGIPIDATAPDTILPLRSNLATWQITSWDPVTTQVYYHTPTLLSAIGIAIFIALAGSFAYLQQQRALKLAEQRVSFANQVSHELRTPLTNILLNLDLAADSVSQQPEARQRLGLIREETARLSRLLENVLSFSNQNRGQTTTPRLHPCDVLPIVEEVLDQFRPSLGRKNLAAIISASADNIKVIADTDSLSQILSNLVSNVEKYAAAGKQFEIDLSQDTANHTAIISVSDQGPGIEPNQRRKIFAPFTRLTDSTTEGVSGTGLGLTISRDLAEKMNGKLKVTDRLDHKSGARFELTLPLAPTTHTTS